MFVKITKDSPKRQKSFRNRVSGLNNKLIIFKEFYQSFIIYKEIRFHFFNNFSKRVEKLFININFAKVNLMQKFYWGRGKFYKHLIFSFLSFIFIFTFLMMWVVQFHSSDAQRIGVKKINPESNNLVSSILSVGTISNVKNTTQSSVKDASYGLINWYKVQPGDTLASISSKFNVPQSVIIWSNHLQSNVVYPGENLNIIPVSGITYTVKNGDTIQSIATKYKTSVSQIEDWNFVGNSTSVVPGKTIFIPNAVIPTPSTSNNISNFATLPNNSGYIQHATTITRVTTKVASVSPYSIYYNQGNPAWGNIRVGYSWDTISEVGCLITDIAMVGKYYGFNITPATIAENPSNFVGPLYNWNGLGIFNVAPLGSLFGGYVNWNAINTQLSLGHPVVVSVGYGYHYVLLLKQLPNGQYLMNDPALGPNLIFNQHYSTASVTQAVLFTPN